MRDNNTTITGQEGHGGPYIADWNINTLLDNGQIILQTINESRYKIVIIN
jgi:hypothetical protein